MRKTMTMMMVNLLEAILMKSLETVLDVRLLLLYWLVQNCLSPMLEIPDAWSVGTEKRLRCLSITNPKMIRNAIGSPKPVVGSHPTVGSMADSTCPELSAITLTKLTKNYL